MIFDHISVGGGVIGVNTLVSLLKKIIKKKLNNNTKIKLCIIDKNLKNVPGGIGYGKYTSKFGYFNNPLRLSPKSLQKYYLSEENFENLRSYILSTGSSNDKKLIDKSLNNLKSKSSKLRNEIYLPRVAVYLWHCNLLLKYLKIINDKFKNIKILFCEGQVTNLKKLNTFTELNSEKKFEFFEIDLIKSGKNNIIFNKINKNKKKLISKFVTVGLGINPPNKLSNQKMYNRKNYIWDYYSEGATNNLLTKIKKKIEKKKLIKLCFIGSKAGFLESLPELYNIKKKYLNKLKIFCFSEKFESLEPATISFKKKIKLKFLKKNRKDLISAKKIYEEIVREFEIQKRFKNKKYLIWTEILSQKILHKYVNSLSMKELKLYQDIYLHKIRNLTRFTFPETVKIKNKMLKNGMIQLINKNVDNVFEKKNYVYVIAKKKEYKFDLVVNVTGPSSILHCAKEIPIYKSFIKSANPEGTNLKTKKNFELVNLSNIFTPGTLANGFNNSRKTIIEAIINNSTLSSKSIFNKIKNSYS